MAIKTKQVPAFNNHLCYSLDDHANVCIFRNSALLSNVRTVAKPFSVEGIGGTCIEYYMVGDHPVFGEMIYSPENKYNIVRQPCLREKGYLLRLSQDNKYYFDIAKVYLEQSDGFYKAPFDRPQPSIELPASAEPQVRSAHPVVAIKSEDTAFESKMYYTEAQQERAQQAVTMHEAMRHPSDAALIEMLKSPLLINCPISSSGVSNARAIYSPRPVKGSDASLDQF